jgi:DNA-directed RNA polymerase subunit H (RpoH/RPB5)|tara:strand:+ start:3423 stop:4052 length:630 start_codon:yes stop_codon:yes gene_type:complete
MNSDNLVLKISKSRKNILEILEQSQNYEVSDYSNFSMHEIDTMYTNNQLDMLIKHKDSDKKTYVKYNITTKPIRTTYIDTIIEDLYTIENVLTKGDNLILILLDNPNDTILNHIKHIYNRDGYFIVVHSIKRLQFNVLQHDLVPNMEILDETQKQDLKKKYNLKDFTQLPEINRFDPQALAMSMRPGDIGKIERNSVTSLNYDYYRYCV